MVNIADYRQAGLRKRTFHYSWCNLTETDYICRRCDTIVPESGCPYCPAKDEAKAAKFQAFLASQKVKNREV